MQIYYLPDFGDQKSKMGLSGTKTRSQQSCVPSGEESVSLPLPASGGSWPHVIPTSASVISPSLTLTLL